MAPGTEPGTDPRAAGERIEALLDRLAAGADRRSLAVAEELLGVVADLYGETLARVVALAAEAAPALLDRLAGDDLVASVLVAHGLHPRSLAERVEAGLERVRPALAAHGGGVEVVGVDAAGGVVAVRLHGSCDGCPSSAATLEQAVQRSVVDAAPEVTRIDVEAPAATAGVPVALTGKPVFDACPADLAAS